MSIQRAPRLAGKRSAARKPQTTRLLFLFLVFLAAALPTRTASAQTGPPAPAGFRSDRILVKPKPGADLTALHAALGAKALRSFPAIGNLQVVQLPPGAPVTTILTAYRQSGFAQYAEPDYIVQTLAEPNDPRYTDGSLWNLHNTGINGGVSGADIKAPEGWDVQNTADSIIVAVIDTGARYTHEDLAANIWTNPGESGPGVLGLDKSTNGLDDDGDGFIDDVHGINAILGTGVPLDDHGHGTHVSGTIGGVGNNGVGVVGVAWRAQIMACKFLDAAGSGSISDAITCIDYARAKGAKIINASWGGYTFNSSALYDAINRARGAGILFVAAAGNDDNNNDINPLYPASYDLDNIIAVAATDRTDNRADFSNYGAGTVDLGAPGLDILSCWNTGDSAYNYLSGTSQATPHVAGACALVWAHYPNDTYAQIKNRVLSNTDRLSSLAGKTVTGGRLNLKKALGGSTPPPAVPVVTVTATDASASESGPDSGTFTITRTGSTASALNVNYSLSGTAQNGADYQTLPGSVTVPAGAASATVTVTPVDDSQAEGSETAILTLSANSAYTAGSPDSATITIADNDSFLSPFVVTPVADLSVSGSPGGPFTPASTTYTLANNTSATLDWSVTENRNWVDVSPTSGTLAPSATAPVTVSLNSMANQLRPGNYTATIHFLNSSAGGGERRKLNLRVVRPATLSLVNFSAGIGLHGGGLPLDAGGFLFRVSGAPANTEVVQASTDLRNWTPVYTNFIPVSGYFDYIDSQAGNFSQRFYRAVPLPGAPVDNLLEGFRSDRILVKPRTGITQGILQSFHDSLGAHVLQSYPAIGQLQVLQVPDTSSASDLIAIYRRSGLVEYAERDFQVHLLAGPNDVKYQDGSLWGLNNTGQLGGVPDADIDAPEAWDIQNSAENVIVAVVDTGARYTHEDLAANVWTNPAEIPGNGIDDDGDGYVDDVHGINTLNNSGDPLDDHGHGTHVSGIIGAVGNNALGIAGVAWRVQLMECKFIDSSGDGFISDAIKCIDYARSHGARVINASWGGTGFTSQALHDAIDSARQAGIIFVVAAGNSSADNDANPFYPASYTVDTVDPNTDQSWPALDNVISVAATTRTDDLAGFSDYGATSVSLGAPGAEILSCWNGSDSDYSYDYGTSMAAPHVSGAAAILIAHYSGEDYRQIIGRILNSVDPLPALAGKCRTGGRLNLNNALTGGAPPPSAPTADFTANPASGNAPLTVQFTDRSTGNVSSRDWDFGDGSPHASEQNPAHTYNSAGDYTVTLTVSGPGGSDSKSATINVTTNAPPPPDEPVITLEASDPDASETGPDNGVITFHRTGDPSQAIAQVNWTFSGTASNGADYEQLPTSSPFPAGLADADLTVKPIDDTQVEGDETVVVTLLPGPGYQVGSPNTATITIHDNDQGPPPTKPTVTVVAGDANASEQGPDTGTFTVSRSGDTASALAVQYSLGGSAANGIDYQSLPNSVTIPEGAASATITLTPVDDTEVEDDETVVLTVSADASYDVGSPNAATITIHDNDSGPPPTKPTVTVVATDADASEQGPDTGTFTISRTGSTESALSVKYSLGGTAVNGTDYDPLPASVTIAAGSSSASVTVTPMDDSSVEGDETVILTVAPDAAYDVGSPASATITIHDNDQPPPSAPTADFSASPTSGDAPLNVQFTDQSSGDISSRDWNFGDGSSHSSAQNPSHTYSSAGDYTATLTVSGSGGSDSKSVSIHVTNPPPPPSAPTADFSASPTSGDAPLNVQFTDQSSGDISSHDWNFGDGSSHSSAQNPSHTYSSAGDYTATLTVSGPGGSDSKSVSIHVTNPPPPPPALKADFTASPLLGIVPLVVQFTDKSTGNPVAWNWNFGDGSASTAQNPSHIYVLPGTYTATLTVRNSGGDTSSASKTIQATVLGLPESSQP